MAHALVPQRHGPRKIAHNSLILLHKTWPDIGRDPTKNNGHRCSKRGPRTAKKPSRQIARASRTFDLAARFAVRGTFGRHRGRRAKV